MKNGKTRIPLLPGMVFEDLDRKDFAKKQNFTIYRNTMIETKKVLNPKPKIKLLDKFYESLQNP